MNCRPNYEDIDYCVCGEQGEVESQPFNALVMPTGTQVVVQDTPIERYRPNTARILSGPDSGGRYWIEMSTGVQWNCPGHRIIGA